MRRMMEMGPMVSAIMEETLDAYWNLFQGPVTKFTAGPEDPEPAGYAINQLRHEARSIDKRAAFSSFLEQCGIDPEEWFAKRGL